MERTFLVCNRKTNISSFLRGRSICDVVEERRTLSDIDIGKLKIIDVERTLYIYYRSDDDDKGLRADMNALRNLMDSAFFNTDSIMFIFVDAASPLIDELVKSALRNSRLTPSDIDIIHHTGALLQNDVAKYLTGSAFGTDGSSTYSSVYIREAEVEEKDRFENTLSEVDTVLPVLTDTALLYSQKVKGEVATSNRVITDKKLDESVRILEGFTPSISYNDKKQFTSFVVSGLKHTEFECVGQYIADHCASNGDVSLIINMTGSPLKAKQSPPAKELSLALLSKRMKITDPISVMNISYSDFGYFLEMSDSFSNIDNIIVICPSNNYNVVCDVMIQVSENLYSAYTIPFDEDYIKDYIEERFFSNTLFLDTKKYKADFDASSYKEDFSNTVVAILPQNQVDCYQIYTYLTGGK